MSPRSPRKKAPVTYASAGVDIDAGDSIVAFLRRQKTDVGGFSSLMALPPGLKQPRLLMATDGVGTKLLVAQLAGKHDSIGIDLVAMVVNDLITCGGRPLYFLDYFATGKLETGVAQKVLRGILKGCDLAGIGLVGGETAEMPGMYRPGHYDLAGFGVGVVEERRIVDGKRVRAGDVVLGFISDGLHSNGYSLARAALLPPSPTAAKKALSRTLPGSRTTIQTALLRPTKIYVKTVLDLVSRFPVHAMANITGGGIEGNLVRVLPQGVRGCIEKSRWKVPPIFTEIARRGPVEEAEMFRTFNMGIGYVLVVPESSASAILSRCRELKQPCRPIGWIAPASKKKSPPEVLLLDR
jgi:phosphoribosylformylglycinamidine cyclo-ligase